EVYLSEPVKPSIKALESGIFDNSRFRHFLIFWTMWCFCANFVGSYLNRYAVNELGITYTQMTLFGSITSNIVSMIAVRIWSHLAIRYGFKPVLRIAATGASLVQLLFMLARPHEVWPIMLYYGIGSIFWSGTNLVASNLQLSLTSDENRARALAVFGCVTALLGTFCGIMLGGSMLEFLEGKALPLSLNRYQCAILTAVIMRFTTAMVMIPGFENDRHFTTADMLRDLLGIRKAKIVKTKDKE
ncbi:MAG: MFS transporter, partial [Oscillospiraceae bacterium]|nr:MFS transporter [Oscillospiraceae bacterium]